MSGTEGQLDVDTAQLLGEAAVLVLGIDDVNLDASPERAEHQRGKQVRLACAGVPKHADVGVRVAAVIEWINENRRACCSVASDDQSTRLLQIWLEPGKERDQRARVQDALALQPVEADRQRGEVPIEHAERTELELAE